jgi:hypothetical protein
MIDVVFFVFTAAGAGTIAVAVAVLRRRLPAGDSLREVRARCLACGCIFHAKLPAAGVPRCPRCDSVAVCRSDEELLITPKQATAE